MMQREDITQDRAGPGVEMRTNSGEKKRESKYIILILFYTFLTANTDRGRVENISINDVNIIRIKKEIIPYK